MCYSAIHLLSTHLTDQSKMNGKSKWASVELGHMCLLSWTVTVLSKNIHSSNECMFAPSLSDQHPETHLPPPALWPPAPSFFISRFPDNAQGIVMSNPLHPSLSLSLPPSPHLFSQHPPFTQTPPLYRQCLGMWCLKCDNNNNDADAMK